MAMQRVNRKARRAFGFSLIEVMLSLSLLLLVLLVAVSLWARLTVTQSYQVERLQLKTKMQQVLWQIYDDIHYQGWLGGTQIQIESQQLNYLSLIEDNQDGALKWQVVSWRFDAGSLKLCRYNGGEIAQDNGMINGLTNGFSQQDKRVINCQGRYFNVFDSAIYQVIDFKIQPLESIAIKGLASTPLYEIKLSAQLKQQSQSQITQSLWLKVSP
ncbi:MAG: hypothetical protein ACPHV3_04885 [Vibrio sp.]